MFLVILKAFMALLLKGNVKTTSWFLKILWFIPWGNWVPNVLIQWSSFWVQVNCFSAFPWSRICSMGYKIMFSSAPKEAVCIIEMPRNWTIFIFYKYLICNWAFYLLNNNLFQQHIHLHKLHWMIYDIFRNNLITQSWKIEVIIITWFFI